MRKLALAIVMLLASLNAKAQEFEIHAVQKPNGDVVLDSKAQGQLKGLIGAMDAEIARLQEALEKQKRATSMCKSSKWI